MTGRINEAIELIEKAAEALCPWSRDFTGAPKDGRKVWLAVHRFDHDRVILGFWDSKWFDERWQPVDAFAWAPFLKPALPTRRSLRAS